jgi:hypothetical protein
VNTVELVDLMVAALQLVSGTVATIDALVRLRMTVRERRSDDNR